MKTLIKFVLALLLVQMISTTDYCDELKICRDLNHCESNKCKHDPIFPISFFSIIGLLMVIVCSALSNAGGIGGGGLLIPLLIVVLGFYTHEAIPISKLMIFTGALTSFILGFKQKHPHRNSITIDYNIPLLLVPMLLFGTMVGVTLNKITPPIIILVSLTLILVLNTYKTFKKGFDLLKKEKQARSVEVVQEMKITSDSPNKNFDYKELKEDSEKNNNHSISIDGKKQESTMMDINSPHYEKLKIEEEKDSRKIPIEKFVLFISCYLIMLLVTFLKGSNYMASIIGVKSCSAEFWLIYFAYLPIGLGLTYYSSQQIKKEYEYRKSIGYPFDSHDVKWDTSIFIKYPLYSFLSGILAGLLGIGGGLIIGPLLLELGLHPMISTATSNFMVLFTSSSTSIQFIIVGMMNFDYGLACTICSTIGSFVGTIIIQRFIERTKKFSTLVLILASVLGISAILIPGYTAVDIYEKVKENIKIWDFGNPC